jgi:hypothetical protein
VKFIIFEIKISPMRKIIFLPFVVLLAAGSCKKKSTTAPTPAPAPAPAPAADTTRPVLTLNGNIKDTVLLQSAYTDPGATANDNVDGDRTPFIIKTGTVNTSAAGTYTLGYEVKDVALNKATETRTVHVRSSIWNAQGNYMSACTCVKSNPGVTPDSTYTSNGLVSVNVSSSVNNNFTLSSLNIGTGTPATNIAITRDNSNGLTFSLSQNNAFPASRTGSFAFGPPVTFTLVTKVYRVDYPNIQYNCTTAFTKQ